MSSSDFEKTKGVSNVSLRREWDKQEYRKRALEREEQLNRPTKLKQFRNLEERSSNLLSGRLEEDAAKTKAIQGDVGFSKVVTQSERADRNIQGSDLADESFQGFLCDVCGRTYMDNASYLDHLNSRMHLANMGLGLEVKRSSIEEVQSRIRLHISKKLLKLEGKEESLEKDLENYNFDEQVELLKEEDEASKLRNKLSKLRKKQGKKPVATENESEPNEELIAALGFGGFK